MHHRGGGGEIITEHKFLLIRLGGKGDLMTANITSVPKRFTWKAIYHMFP